MIKSILSVLLFSSITSYSQTNIKGSYFIAAICKDGIVIGADTRGAVLDSLSRPYGYFDSVQKVFALKNAILAEAGYISLHQRFFSDYIQKFTKKNLNTNVVTLIPLLIKFIISESPFSDTRDHLFASKLITAGYDSGIAKICVMGRWNFQTYGRKYVYAVDGLTRFGEGKEYNSDFCFNHTTKEVGKLIEEEIMNYAIDQNRTDYIGKPIMVVKINSRNKISWIRNEHGGKNYKDNKNIYTSYVNGKIKIHFKTKDGKKYFLTHH